MTQNFKCATKDKRMLKSGSKKNCVKSNYNPVLKTYVSSDAAAKDLSATHDKNLLIYKANNRLEQRWVQMKN